MSTDDEFARSLRERADAAVPAMSLDPATTLHQGRRRTRTRHAWQVGSVVAAVGVVAVVVAPILPGTGPAWNGTAAQVAASKTPRPTGTDASAQGSNVWTLILAKTKLLQSDMARARAVPLDSATWDALASRLDALVAEAEANPGHEQRTGAVELGLFVFPQGYGPRSTEWIGWDDGTRVTITEDTTSPRLRMSFTQGAAAIPDVVLPARGTGSLSLVTTHGHSHLLDGDVLTYEDERGERFELDVVTHEWRVTPTAPANLATTGSTAVPTASDAPTSGPTAGPTGTGDGHTAPDAQDRRIQERAESLMSAMGGAVGDGDESEDDPGVTTTWRGLDHELDTLVSDAEQQGFSHGDAGARVVELGFFTYPNFLHDRSAEWVGWIDGQRATVAIDAGGHARYAGPGSGGKHVDAVVPRNGSRLVDVATYAYDRYLVGSVLGFTDRDGKDHHLDLLTRTWLD